MLKIVISNKFEKDLKIAKKRNCKFEKLREVVEKLSKNEKLEAKYNDHSLIGNYKHFRECHIEPDWLLIYRVDKDILHLFLFRTGTHSDLF